MITPKSVKDRLKNKALTGRKYPRATRDLDLLARNVHNSEEKIKKIFEKIFSVE